MTCVVHRSSPQSWDGMGWDGVGWDGWLLNWFPNKLKHKRGARTGPGEGVWSCVSPQEQQQQQCQGLLLINLFMRSLLSIHFFKSHVGAFSFCVPCVDAGKVLHFQGESTFFLPCFPFRLCFLVSHGRFSLCQGTAASLKKLGLLFPT